MFRRLLSHVNVGSDFRRPRPGLIRVDIPARGACKRGALRKSHTEPRAQITYGIRIPAWSKNHVTHRCSRREHTPMNAIVCITAIAAALLTPWTFCPTAAQAASCESLRLKAAKSFAGCGYKTEKKTASTGQSVADWTRCRERLVKAHTKIDSVCAPGDTPRERDLRESLQRVGAPIGWSIRTGEPADLDRLCGPEMSWDFSARQCSATPTAAPPAAAAPSSSCALAGIKAAQSYSSCLFAAEKKAAKKGGAVDTSRCEERLDKYFTRATTTCAGSVGGVDRDDLGTAISEVTAAVAAAAAGGTAADLSAFCEAGLSWDASAQWCSEGNGSASLPTGVTPFFIDQTVDGQVESRRYLVAAPASFEPGKKYPLWFGFHGSGGTGDAYVPAFAPWVSAGDFIGVYPDGLENSWNLGPEASNADDVEFVEKIVRTLAGYEQVDTSRIFAYGSSNGAGISHKIATETDLFDGIAAVVTSLLQDREPAPASKAVAVLQVLGTVDNAVPYEGGTGILGHQFLDAEESADLWAAASTCAEGPTRTTTAEGNIRIDYAECSDGREVRHYGIVGGGHGLPGSTEGGLTALAVDFLLGQPD